VFLAGRDRDTEFTAPFDAVFTSVSMRIIILWTATQEHSTESCFSSSTARAPGGQSGNVQWVTLVIVQQ